MDYIDYVDYVDSYLLKCAKLSEISYTNNISEIQRNFKDIELIENPLVSCYIFQDIDKFYIVFRGADSASDISTCFNFNMTRIDDNNSLIHNGYLESYNSIKDYIMSSIQINDKNNQNKVKHLIFIGHSMGGALGALAAYDVSTYYKNNNNKYISCVSFASPPVGNEDFARNFYNNVHESYRVTNDYDLIPKIPLYKHVHGEIKLKVVDKKITHGTNFYNRFIIPHNIECYVQLLQSRSNRNLKLFHRHHVKLI